MNEQQDVATRESERTEGPAQTGESETRSEFVLAPDVDIYEDSEGIHMWADMPGVSGDRLDIQVNRDVLTIEGEARIDMPEDMEALYADVRTTRFRRSFALSAELDTDKIDARLKDGVLNMRIPKRAEAKPRKIEVSVG